MTHPLQNRAQRSKLHLSVLRGLGVSPDEPQTTADAAKQAFAEAIAWADTDNIADLGTLFSLSDAIDFHVTQAIHHADSQFAEVDANELRKVHGAATVNLALKLAGYSPRQRGRRMIWTDAPLDAHARNVTVTLPIDLLETWSAT